MFVRCELRWWESEREIERDEKKLYDPSFRIINSTTLSFFGKLLPAEDWPCQSDANTSFPKMRICDTIDLCCAFSDLCNINENLDCSTSLVRAHTHTHSINLSLETFEMLHIMPWMSPSYLSLKMLEIKNIVFIGRPHCVPTKNKSEYYARTGKWFRFAVSFSFVKAWSVSIRAYQMKNEWINFESIKLSVSNVEKKNKYILDKNQRQTLQ